MTTQWDSNVWYHLTEARVSLGSALQSVDNRTARVYIPAGNDITDHRNFWQLIKTPNSPSVNPAYYIRCRDAGPQLSLTACFNPVEEDQSRTGTCLNPTDPDLAAQQWTIDPWMNDVNGTYRIKNLGNGTDYNLSVHQGNPIYMTSNVADNPHDVGQHWTIVPMGIGPAAEINDPSFSSIVGGPTAQPPSSQPTHVSAPSTLSSGATAGIAVGVVIFVTLCFSIGFFFLYRHRQRRQTTTGELDEKEVVVEKEVASTISKPSPVEVHSSAVYELENTGMAAELEHHNDEKQDSV